MPGDLSHPHPEEPARENARRELADLRAFLSERNLAGGYVLNNVGADRYDARLFSDVLDAEPELRALVDRAGNDAPKTFGPLVLDIFVPFYKMVPELLPETSVDPSYLRANRPFVKRMREDEETLLARLNTATDEVASALATIEAAKAILRELFRRPALRDWMDRRPEPDDAPEDPQPGADAPAPQGEPDDPTPGGAGEGPPPERPLPNEPPPEGGAGEDSPPDSPAPHTDVPEDAPAGFAADLRALVRAASRAGSAEAVAHAAALRDWGLKPADLRTVPGGERLEIARKLRTKRMRDLADLLGRMRNYRRASERRKVKANRDEIHAIRTSGDLSRALPSEVAGAFGSKDPHRKRDFYRRLSERAVLSYSLRTDEPVGRGPVIAMIDACLTGETKVLGPDGVKRIDEMCAGDRVYSYVDGKLESRTVTKAWFTKRQDVFKVRTSNRSLLASANHPFLRLRKVPQTHLRESSGRFASAEWAAEWVRADELERGDRVVTLRRASDDGRRQTLADGTPLSRQVAWLLGLIAGDGWVSPAGVAICVYGEVREKAARICKQVWGANNSRHETYGIRVNSTRLRDVLRKLDGLNDRSHKKRVPWIVQRSCDEVKRAFLDGYAAADGHEMSTGRVYSSTSQDLISEVRMMHVALGDHVTNLTLTANQPPALIRGKVVTNRRPYWRFHVARRKPRGLSDGKVPAALRGYLDGPFAYQQVLSVESAGERDTYDLEIEGSHNFVAEGMVVHNSRSMTGPPMEWASAIALALAHAASGGSGVKTGGFGGARRVHAVFFNAEIVLDVEFHPGEKDVRKFLSVGTVDADGGTKYVPPISRALEILDEGLKSRERAREGTPDLLLVTDGICKLPEEYTTSLSVKRTAHGFKLVTVLVGDHARAGAVEPFSDKVIRAVDLTRASGARDAAGALFDSL